MHVVVMKDFTDANRVNSVDGRCAKDPFVFKMYRTTKLNEKRKRKVNFTEIKKQKGII